MKKICYLTLLSTLLISCSNNVKFVPKRSNLGDDTKLIDFKKSKPGCINKKEYESKLEIHFNDGDITYYNISDSSTQSITYGYGLDNDGIGSSLYLESPGGGFNASIRARTSSKTDISNCDGIMFYVDLSNVEAEVGNHLGVGVGLIMMDSANEPPTSEYLWEASKYGGHFNHYYPLEGSSAYYYDLFEGCFKPTTIIEENVVVNEGYQGWIYIPFASYSWNGTNETEYIMIKDAFENGYNWLNYSHFLTKNIKSDDAQSRIRFDEFNFVKLGADHTPTFTYQKDLESTCFDIGGKIYLDETSHNYQLSDITNKKEHNYSYIKYKDGAIGVCSLCGDLIFTNDSSIVESAIEGDTSNYVDLHFHFGKDYENEETIIVKKGNYLPTTREPRVNRTLMDDGWEYDFSVWSSSSENYVPRNPLATLHYQSSHYYAKYLVSSYDNIKYSHVPNLLAMSGGRYYSPQGKIVMNGNSNFALAYQTTNDFAQRGLPLINNAVAGGSTYDYYHYSDQLVIGFAPKIVLFNLSSNDQAYWSMSEKDIINMTDKYIQKIHKILPDVQFAMVSASPLPGRSEMFATLERINEKAANYADKYDYVYFIDTYDFVYQRMMEYPDGWEFWTHMDTETLSTWMNLIADGVEQIVNEKGIIF